MLPVSPPGLRRLRVALAVALALCVVPSGASAQSSACRFGAGTGSFQAITLAGGGRIVYVSRPNIVCDDGVRIRADSAVTQTMQNMSHLMGNVWYRDGTRELRSDEARYFSQQGRLQAHGNVFLRDTIRGSEIEHGDLVYLRQTSFRDEEEITVTRNVSEGERPRALLYMRPAPDTVAADTAAAVAPDTTMVVPDSVLAVPDTAAVPDSMAALPDTAAAPDTVLAPDTVPSVVDSLPAVPDSVAVVPDSAAAAPDSVVADTAVAVALDTTMVVPDTVLAVPDTAAVPDSVAAIPDTAATPATAATPDTVSAAVDSIPPVPYEVEADRLFLQGDRFFRAVGRVVVERDSLQAFADTARYDQDAGTLELHGSARVEGQGYDLSGRQVHLAVPGGDVRSVRAVRDGVLSGERLLLVAPVIELFLSDGAMERLVAVPLRPDPETTSEEPPDSTDLARPVATAEEFRLEADSVEVLAPGEALERINAVGRARGESTARDSLNVEDLPETARRDWLEGDTVVATFVEAEARQGEPRDTTAGEYVLERLVARGSARSLYRLLPSDSATRPGVDPPAVHYVTGSTIVIVMGDGDVDRMEVEGPTRGWHLEPATGAPEDTTQAPDSLAPDTVPPDTAAMRGADGGPGPGTPSPGTSDPPDAPGPADLALPAAGFLRSPAVARVTRPTRLVQRFPRRWRSLR